MNYFLLLYLVLLIGGVIILLGEERNPISTLSWLLVVIFIPVVGEILYFIFGYSVRRRRQFRREREERKGIEAPSPELISTGEELVSRLPHRGDRELLDLVSSWSGVGLQSVRRAMVYEQTDDWASALWSDLTHAQREICVQLYRLEDHPFTRQLLSLLEEKMMSGVRVFLLYDDVGSRAQSSRFVYRLERSGVTSVPFRPVYIPFFTSRVNYRNHRNLVSIDGVVGYMGNLSLGRERSLAHILLRVEGDVVRAMRRSFEEDFCLAQQSRGEKVQVELSPLAELEGLEPIPLPRMLETGLVTQERSEMLLLSTNPTDRQPMLEMLMVQAILSAERSVRILSPVLIPTRSILHALSAAALSGVEVTIVLPRRSSLRLASIASKSFFPELLRSGVEIHYDYEAEDLINYFLIDGCQVWLGSPYLDFRSFENNFELIACIWSESLASSIGERFEERRARSKSLKLRPIRWRKRLTYGIMRQLTPLL